MKEHGLTFIELLISTAIVSIVTAIALPNIAQWVRQQDMQTSSHLLTHSLALARQEAVIRHSTVSMIRNETWQQGWRVFVDTNSNAVMDGDDTLLHTQMPLHNVIIRGNSYAANYVMYNDDGRSVPAGFAGNAWASSTMTVCPTTADQASYQIIIAKGGRVRIERTNASQCL